MCICMYMYVYVYIYMCIYMYMYKYMYMYVSSPLKMFSYFEGLISQFFLCLSLSLSLFLFLAPYLCLDWMMLPLSAQRPTTSKCLHMRCATHSFTVGVALMIFVGCTI